MIFEDGRTGNGPIGGNKHGGLSVDPENALAVAAMRGDAYSWDAPEVDVGAGATVLFVKNNSGERNLVLDSLTINGTNVIAFWDIGIGADVTVPAGTEVTSVNQNPAFGNNAPVNAKLTETAVADAAVVRRVKTPVDNTVFVPVAGIVLGPGCYIQINQETESDSGSVTLVGHFA